MLSRFFSKNFVKATYLLQKSLKSLFDEKKRKIYFHGKKFRQIEYMYLVISVISLVCKTVTFTKFANLELNYPVLTYVDFTKIFLVRVNSTYTLDLPRIECLHHLFRSNSHYPIDCAWKKGFSEKDILEA